jgi:hypothetical protein
MVSVGAARSRPFTTGDASRPPAVPGASKNRGRRLGALAVVSS